MVAVSFKVGVVLISVYLIGMVSFTPASVAAFSSAQVKVYSLQTQQPQPLEQVIDRLVDANVVYLAETHERPEDHQAQLEIVRSLASRRPLIIGMEMFQRPFQWVLDDYLTGRITEAELVRRTQYQKRWGYTWEFYAPILRFAQSQQIPVLALNTPSEVTRKVARSGLDSLTLAERQWIPPQSSILTQPDAYRQRIRQLYDEMHQGKGNSANFERFFQAQVLWDETMAERVAIALRQSPAALVVVLAGQGHILYGDGIPNRVLRRLQQWRPQQSLKQAIVILNPPEDLPKQPAIADYFWYSP